MPEQNNDMLEQFFRKAAARADVTFNEDDWKKLEARLDAADAGNTIGKKSGAKAVASVIVVSLLLLSTAVWFNFRFDANSSRASRDPETAIQPKDAPFDVFAEEEGDARLNDESESNAEPGAQSPDDGESGIEEVPSVNRAITTPKKETLAAPLPSREQQTGDNIVFDVLSGTQRQSETQDNKDISSVGETEPSVERTAQQSQNVSESERQLPVDVPHKKPDATLITESLAVAERNKQKAVVELPGAEEGETIEAEAMVQEEHASDKKKHGATPRLSLLLSFAPDFSGTSMGQYSAPGKAYGAMLQYHFLNRFSIAAGVIKNHKQYTGAGDDYRPPKGYWKYYTNGIIPETIDGSCSILEFPVMLQYTIASNGKHRWNAGAGVSSYLMQTESYRYNFDQPNPGAKEGWNSYNSSRFLFNMVNFAIGYERQVLPGLMLGIEPYVKIPLEEIGWSNLRLFSAGASVTVRYSVLRKQNFPIPTRSRGPD